MAADPWQRFVQEFRQGSHKDFAEHWELFQELSRSRPESEGPLPVWRPGPQELESSNLAALLRHVGLATHTELHRWSAENREEFWQVVIDRLGIAFHRAPERILDLAAGVEQPRWLSGAELNIVDSCLRAPSESPAIVHASETDPQPRVVTYGELEARIDRVAAGLREHGFHPDDAIVLYMPMTVDCVAAYLGILRYGCRVVSVADSFSAAELHRRMEIAGASTVITLAGYPWAGRRIDLYSKVRQACGRLAGQTRAVVIPEASDATLELAAGDLLWSDFLGSDPPPPTYGPPDRITNVLFSSGTTGTPKAIPWTHLTPLKCAMDAHFHHDVRPGDVVAWPTSIGWMMGPWLIYAALINRAAMALFQGAPHSRSFIDFVDAAGVTMLGLVPALVRTWRARDLVAPDSWRQVRIFSSTGEVSNPEDYLWLMSRSGYRAPVIEYLGGTEIGGGHATGSVLRPASPSTFSTPALGLDFVILDERNQPTLPGELGELYLIPPSIGLSQTLLNRDHHEIYYADCPPGPAGEVLRRHGDDFVALADGYFRTQGRTDDTMNLSGIKVSSIELEEVINEHPSVFESAAVAVPIQGEGAASLVVYVVQAEVCEPSSLRQELDRRLAAEINPLFRIHEVVVTESLPRTASNKVIRRKLRDRYLQSQQEG